MTWPEDFARRWNENEEEPLLEKRAVHHAFLLFEIVERLAKVSIDSILNCPSEIRPEAMRDLADLITASRFLCDSPHSTKGDA